MKTTFIATLLSLSFLLSAQERTIQLQIETELGNMLLELYPDAAPLTCANFLKYVDAGHFSGASFYRTVTMNNQPDNDIKIEVIQGGLAGSGKLAFQEVVYAPVYQPLSTKQQMLQDSNILMELFPWPVPILAPHPPRYLFVLMISPHSISEG